MKTILLVDSSKLVLNALKKAILKDIQANILTATSKSEALTLIEQNSIIHIAVVDINLSDAPSGELINETIKKDIPTVVLTSNIDEHIKDFILQKDILDFILKNSPNSLKNILSMIDRTLKNYDTFVLAVDDSQMQLVNAKKLLNQIKLNVDTALDGKEALELIEKNPNKYSLVLTDYNMPQMDGMELTLKIRQRYNKDKLAIIVVSANGDTKIPTEFLKIGANDFVHKPYSKIELKTRVNNTLDSLDFIQQTKLQNKELQEYLELIEQVAFILKINKDLNIIYANSIFFDTTQYIKEDIYNKPYDCIVDSSVPKETIDILWNIDKVSKAKIKHIDKNGEIYFTNETIMPILDINKEIKEYISIGFLTTEDELKQREFKNQVIQQLKQMRLRENEYKKKIADLEVKLSSLSNVAVSINNLENLLKKEKSKNKRLEQDIRQYQISEEKIKEKGMELANKFKTSLENCLKSKKSFDAQTIHLKTKIIKLEADLKNSSELVNRLQSGNDMLNNRVKELEDVIKHQDLKTNKRD